MSTFGVGKFGSTALAVAASVVLVAGCSSSGSSPASKASKASKASTASAGAGGLQTRSTTIGTVLVDSAGRTIYELDGDAAANQTCTGSCQAIWPPVTANGSQLIVNGHPAFTFTGDSSAGQTNGQGVQDRWGHWRALDANGNPITASSTTPTTSSSGGGGYKY
jgi:predicted lipoprotein with Yx(FWY)xxD motif